MCALWRTFEVSVAIQDVPVASSELPESAPAASSVAVRRIVTYLMACAALVVVLWALIEGGERDLWIRPAAFLHASVPSWAS